MRGVVMLRAVQVQTRTRLRASSRSACVASSAAAPPPPSPSGPPKCFLLTYKYVADILERRGPYREAHLAAASAQCAAGKMLLAGAFLEPTDGAAFVFTSHATRAGIAEFVASDPYVLAGLVTAHECREWAVPVSAAAAAVVL
jgi:uncharacterized protein YciI